MLAGKDIGIKKKVIAQKEKIDEDAAWRHIIKFEKIVIAKGKAYSEFTVNSESKAEILKQAIGRSGNLRAPSLEVGKTLVVGFNETMYDKFIK